VKLGVIDILKIAGFDPALDTKLVRHKDPRISMEDLLDNDADFDLYQSYQRRPKFANVEQIVSFYGLPGTKAGFYGVYKVLGCHPAEKGPGVPPGRAWGQDVKYYYELERDPRFDCLKHRLIVDWGKGAINWVQYAKNIEVVEVLSSGRTLAPFKDYLKFSLNYAELKSLFSNEEAHSDWKKPLESVFGVYLILAEGSGDQYVGSAYGEDGIWGRWRHYAHSGLEDNVKLKELMKSDPSYPGKFRFSILQILPKSTTKNEALKWETIYMRKLGTRAIGLN
jgi:hypothetical protein